MQLTAGDGLSYQHRHNRFPNRKRGLRIPYVQPGHSSCDGGGSGLRFSAFSDGSVLVDEKRAATVSGAGSYASQSAWWKVEVGLEEGGEDRAVERTVVRLCDWPVVHVARRR